MVPEMNLAYGALGRAASLKNWPKLPGRMLREPVVKYFSVFDPADQLGRGHPRIVLSKSQVNRSGPFTVIIPNRNNAGTAFR